MPTPLDLNLLTVASMHEVKNLLGQLTLSLEEIAQVQCPGAEQKIASARFACSRVVDRLTEMMVLYKLDGEHLHPSIAAHSPNDFLEDLMLSAKSLTAGRIEIRLQSSEQTPEFWFFDRDLIESAFMNAVHNALLYARSWICLSAEQADGYLVLRVADDGIGYPTELLHANLDAPRPSKHGCGLGLYFANSVALAHRNQERHGKVALSNGENGGAILSLYLP